MSDWNPVSEKLPEIREPWEKKKDKPYVLVCDAKGRMSVAFRHSAHPQAWTMAKPIGEVTHWMPLPELPK